MCRKRVGNFPCIGLQPIFSFGFSAICKPGTQQIKFEDIVLWDVISIAFTKLSFNCVNIFMYIFNNPPLSMSPQGDVPRQLGWSAADHWGLAAWMNGKSTEKRSSHIGFPKILRLDCRWSGWVGQVYGWYHLAEDRCTSMLAWKQVWDLCIDEGLRCEITCIPAFFQQKEAALKITFKRPLWFNTQSWDLWM